MTTRIRAVRGFTKTSNYPCTFFQKKGKDIFGKEKWKWVTLGDAQVPLEKYHSDSDRFKIASKRFERGGHSLDDYKERLDNIIFEGGVI